MTRVQSPIRVLQVALALGWSTDVLFYGKSIGISLLLFVLLLLTALFSLSRMEGVRVLPRNLWLLAPLLFFAAMAFVRANTTLTFLNVAAVFVLLTLLGFFYAVDRIERLGLLGYPAVVAIALKNLLVRPAPEVAKVARTASAQRQRARFAASLLRGIVLAIPVLFVFTLLLSSADTIFADYIADLFRLDFMSDSPEMLWRASLVLLASWLIAGGLLFALNRRASQPGNAPDDLPGKLKTEWSLGFIEGATVLAMVNVLFAVFGWIQFSNIFLGQPSSMFYEEYREYVRRGFGEMLTVAVLTMLLIVGLRRIVWKETRREIRLFTILSSVMVALTMVILVSAFQRMLVWEEVQFYINTPTRIYVRAFIVWLSLLFVWLFSTLWLRRTRFAIGAFLAGMGFLVTINLMNPDADVAARNLQRNDELSTRYLYLLSEDAIPVLVTALDRTSGVVQYNIRWHLTYRLRDMENDRSWQSWPSFHLSRWQAYEMLKRLRTEGKIVNIASLHSP